MQIFVGPKPTHALEASALLEGVGLEIMQVLAGTLAFDLFSEVFGDEVSEFLVRGLLGV